MKEEDKKYWIFGGMAAGAAIATNLINYLLTSYFVGKNYENQLETKNKIVAEQKITIDSLADSLKSIRERKEDYQKALKIMCKYLNPEVDVEKKIVEAYENKMIKNGDAFRQITKYIPSYKPKTSIKSKKK
ncbi:MAG: hypothetical protein N3G19_02800 [Candidatus Pacearchaeota archaeon]|nr:hypothetical protein [Candidatus Pacearchaeota archaeon]